MLDQLKKALQERGYQILQRPYELNIVGIRSNSTVPNRFDDAIAVFYNDAFGKAHLQVWAATTDPSTYCLYNPMNLKGTAILKEGQYIGAYAIGMHRGKYPALVQVKPVTVYRDTDKNNILNFNAPKQEKGLFGINIHRAQEAGTSKFIDKYSAGCQVFANASDFNKFMALCQAHQQRYGNVFTYTLLMGFIPPIAQSQTESLPQTDFPMAA